MLQKVKLFFVYLIIEKLLWLSMFIVLLGIGLLISIATSWIQESLFLDIVLNGSTFIILSFLIYLIYRHFKKRRGINIFAYLKLTTLTNSKKDLLIAFAILFAYASYCFLFRLPVVQQGLDFMPSKAIGSISMHIALVLLMVAWEEICARGFVLTKLSEKMTFQSANFLAAGIFTASHYFLAGGQANETNFLYTTTSLTLASVSIRFLLGYIAGIVMQKSKSVWFAIILHSIHNLIRL